MTSAVERMPPRRHPDSVIAHENTNDVCGCRECYLRRSGSAVVERAKSHCKIDEQTGCWVWTSSVSPRGLPVMSLNQRKNSTARAIIWRIVKGEELGVNIGVVMTCKTKLCVNPEHMTTMSRTAQLIKSKRTKRTLDVKLVAWIKRQLRMGLSLYVIGQQTGVRIGQIAQIRDGKGYREVRPLKGTDLWFPPSTATPASASASAASTCTPLSPTPTGRRQGRAASAKDDGSRKPADQDARPAADAA